MRLSPDRLLPPQHAVYYLYGEDTDGLLEAAEALLASGDEQALRLRVDIHELERIERETRNQGLFGSVSCHALIRNAQSASPKQGEHLLRLIDRLGAGHRLIICAPGMDWKKALHRKLRDMDGVASCEFREPDVQGFERWLTGLAREAGVQLKPDVLPWLAERLCGMRLASRQLMQRLQWYDDGCGETLGIEVVGELLGERAPEALDDLCRAVASRRPEALRLVRRLLRDQQVAEVQLLSWLGTRIQQLLLYSWFVARKQRNALQAAHVFGDARKHVASEARHWRGAELVDALERLVEAEKRIKGSSVEDNAVVIERLVVDLVRPGALA